MARAHETERLPDCLEADDSQPLIAIPTEDGKTLYFTSDEAADAILTEETLQRALDLAGAWSDLADEDVEGELEALRRAGKPSAPLAE